MPKTTNHIKMSFWHEKEAKGLFQELPFYNTFIEKPRINVLKTQINCMSEHFMINQVLKKYQKHLKDTQEVIELK